MYVITTDKLELHKALQLFIEKGLIYDPNFHIEDDGKPVDKDEIYLYYELHY